MIAPAHAEIAPCPANAAWVQLVDTLAGGLIVLALSGILLWSRLHGTRLAAGLAPGSLSLAGWFAWLSQ